MCSSPQYSSLEPSPTRLPPSPVPPNVLCALALMSTTTWKGQSLEEGETSDSFLHLPSEDQDGWLGNVVQGGVGDVPHYKKKKTSNYLREMEDFKIRRKKREIANFSLTKPS
eukprot:GFUD01120079.1.p1 GENE.GFUD01120079.1~~GFUD01120079.1.p1  ORF type:complete len:112 (-),score=29.94 GFUD01120079.1:53-388(-)